MNTPGRRKRSILQTMAAQIFAVRPVARRDADGLRGTPFRMGESCASATQRAAP